MMKYSLRIKINEVGKNEYEYVAQYDQFPTIIGVGDTPTEALKEAQVILEEYLNYCEKEGIEIKEPQLIDWKDNFSGKITIRLPKSLHRDLSNYAEKDGMSINSIVNDAVRTYLFEQCLAEMKDSIIEAVSNQISGTFVSRFDTPRNDYRQFPKNAYLN